MSNPNVLVGASTRAEDQNYKINIVDNADYTILNNDYYDEVWDDPSSAHREVTFPDPTIAINLHRIIEIKNAGDGSYKITLLPDDTEKFIVYSGNEKWELTSFELLQAGDHAKFIGDGSNWIKCNEPYWHKIDDPATGYSATKTGGWTADQFTPGGFEVTFAAIPLGSIAVQCLLQQYATRGGVYWRKAGDAKVSNTPNADVEQSHYIFDSQVSIDVMLFWISDDFKIELAVTNVLTDIRFGYPSAYLQ